MPDTDSILQAILHPPLIAVIRLDAPDRAGEIVAAIAGGGITTIEVTFTTPGAAELIRSLAARPDLLVGAGSVMTAHQAEEAFEAGASFYASPILDPELVALAHRHGRLAMPGALTPAEIVAAHRAGADLVKIFPMPSDPISYLRSLRGPLPHIPLAPSGGVTAATARPLLQAGAAALNVGSWLTHEGGAILPLETIRERSAQLLQAISDH